LFVIANALVIAREARPKQSLTIEFVVVYHLLSMFIMSGIDCFRLPVLRIENYLVDAAVRNDVLIVPFVPSPPLKKS
jgi:hypothetical protein